MQNKSPWSKPWAFWCAFAPYSYSHFTEARHRLLNGGKVKRDRTKRSPDNALFH